MKRILLILGITLIIAGQIIGQSGSLLVIGGGSEESGLDGWNAEAYQWAVNQSENKKVAVISFTDNSTWLPEHFVSDWGANFSKVFTISTQQ